MDKLLLEYQDILKAIEHLEEERAEILASGGTPKALDGMPHGSGTGDPTSSTGIRAAMIKQEIDDLLKKVEAIRNAVNALAPVESDIIRLRYFRRMNWKDIFKEVNYSERETYRKHKEGLEKIANMAVGDS